MELSLKIISILVGHLQQLAHATGRFLKISLLLSLPLFSTEHDYSLENSNFTLSSVPYETDERVLYNYNRLRLNYIVKEDNWYLSFIGDIDNYYGGKYINTNEYKFLRAIKADTPFDIETNAMNYSRGEVFGRMHRLNVGYADEKHHMVFGLQKISMGVGRIWTPTDLFNPRNPLALEPDQIYGTYAFSYTYALGDLTEVMGVVAKRNDKSYKYAGRIKTNVSIGDIALDLFSGDDAQMIAFEIEGNLFDTGIEWRSEGGYFKDKVLDKAFYQTIVGLDYGFVDGLTVVAEWIHSSKTYTPEEILIHQESALSNNRFTSKDYIGASAYYDFNLLYNGAMSVIYNPHDQSSFLSPLITYSISDDASLALGALLYTGDNESEFGQRENSYYLNFKVTY